MGETGIVRFQGGLDPSAQEFRPTNNIHNLTTTNLLQQHQQLHIFSPPLPQLYYPYTAPPPPPLVGFSMYQHTPPPPPPPPHEYVSAVTPAATVPSCLPPQSSVPTRTLVLNSVPAEVSESIIRRELEVFGEVRGVQMERIFDGIVTVHFYDLRHAELALIEIRNKHIQQQSTLRNLFASASSLDRNNFLAPLPPPVTTVPPAAAGRGYIAGRAVWAQFSIPSCNAVPDGYNHGTIVVFNLDPNISTSSLREIFQAFGEVKELRETPLKKQQRFVEFYDIRDAAKALKEMNGKEINGKQVVIEFSRPGGFGRKFFNATSTKSSPIHSTTNNHNSSIFNAKVSRYTPPPQQQHHQQSPPPPPPPPPPLPRRLSRCSLSNIPGRAFLPSPKSSIFSKGNPNENNSNSNNGMKDSIELSASRLAIDGSGNENVAVDNKVGEGHTLKRSNSSKKSQNNDSNATTAKQQSRSRPWKSRQAKKFDTRFLINEEAMVESSNCSELRTTVMIKNIPNKYSQKLLLNMLDNHCIHCNEQILADGGGNGGGDDRPLSSYDFVYLPIDFNNKCNVGYGFVNMTSPQATWRLYKAFHHQHWEVFNSRKICEVTYARVQGLEALKEHFKNSKFPCEMDHYLPVVFSPPRDGRQQTEPQAIVGHGQKQQSLTILGLHIKNKEREEEEEEEEEDSLNNSNNNSNGDTDQEDQEEEEENLNHNSNSSGNSNSNSSQNGCCDMGGDDDDKDSSSGSLN